MPDPRSRLPLRVPAAALLWLLLAVPAPMHGQAAGAPRLVVLLVVDQMRGDYLTTFAHRWRGGFRRLLDEGAVFEHGDYPYMNTVTCAGHSTIGTGTLPHTHGMTLNAWWERGRGAMAACTDDDSAPNVSYGKPARGGNSGRRLLASTLADEIRAQRPGARVVSLSMKARSAIGMAGHGGDVVTWFDDTADAFVTSAAYAREPVPALQAFLAREPFEADAARVWTLADRPETYRFRDASAGARPPQTWTGLFPHPLAGRSGADALFADLWQRTPFADEYLARMAAAMIDAFALGQRDATDFLGVSFSALDVLGHGFGPESREIEDMLMRLDATLGQLLDRLDRTVGRGRYVLALSADHGVAPVPGAAGGRIPTDDVRERVEEVLRDRFGPRAARYVDAVVFNYVYLAPGVAERLRAAPAVRDAVFTAVQQLPGVERVLDGSRLSPAAADPIVRGAALSYVPERSGDLVVVPKMYWFLAGRGDAGGTTHGTGYPYDRHVPIILFGPTIAARHLMRAATPADIAPTLAAIAGVRLPQAEGRVLEEALR